MCRRVRQKLPRAQRSALVVENQWGGSTQLSVATIVGHFANAGEPAKKNDSSGYLYSYIEAVALINVDISSPVSR